MKIEDLLDRFALSFQFRSIAFLKYSIWHTRHTPWGETDL